MHKAQWDMVNSFWNHASLQKSVFEVSRESLFHIFLDFLDTLQPVQEKKRNPATYITILTELIINVAWNMKPSSEKDWGR